MEEKPSVPEPPPRWQQRLRCAAAHYTDCRLCEYRCHADRSAGQRGPCHAGVIPRVFRHRIEYGEEANLIPSHEFYLSGCDMRCVFCIAGINAFDPGRGLELTSEFFNEAVEWGRHQGARNIQWVGGEPTIHLPAVLEVMAACPNLPPVVWKSDFHFTPEALELLEGVADIYVADFKFGNDRCAHRLSGIGQYVSIVTRNLKLADRRGRLIVRHLLMPGHLNCCLRPVVDWMSQNLPQGEFSLREGYLPNWRASRFVELGRSVSRGEISAARDMVMQAGLKVIS